MWTQHQTFARLDRYYRNQLLLRSRFPPDILHIRYHLSCILQPCMVLWDKIKMLKNSGGETFSWKSIVKLWAHDIRHGLCCCTIVQIGVIRILAWLILRIFITSQHKGSQTYFPTGLFHRIPTKIRNLPGLKSPSRSLNRQNINIAWTIQDDSWTF